MAKSSGAAKYRQLPGVRQEQERATLASVYRRIIQTFHEKQAVGVQADGEDHAEVDNEHRATPKHNTG